VKFLHAQLVTRVFFSAGRHGGRRVLDKTKNWQCVWFYRETNQVQDFLYQNLSWLRTNFCWSRRGVFLSVAQFKLIFRGKQ